MGGRDAIAGAEGEGRLGTGRALTAEKQERILGRTPATSMVQGLEVVSTWN